MFDFCIDQLNSDRLTNHVGKELVGKLLAEVSNRLSILEQVSITFVCVD